jgi:predicted regulator of Ras-like GTPase activity (Roadblock/LC7/MglB family)
LNNVSQAQTTQPQGSEQSVIKADPELQQLKQDVKEWKEFQTKEQQKQAEKTIDNILETMATKFKVSKEMRTVTEEMVISRANLAINQNVPLNNDTWEKIYSGVHAELTAIAKSYNREITNKQQSANAMARDAGAGGQVAGQSPKKMSFREATEAAIRDARTV